MSRQPPSSLALLGGRPCFPQPLHVGRPHPGEAGRLAARVQEILDRRWFTNNGPLVREFEQRIADQLGVRHCIATANATLALELTFEGLKLTGDVVVPAFTFVATVSALVRRGLRPRFCDVDPRTHQIDLQHAARLITPRTSALLAVHLWGSPCDVTGLEELAARHGLRLIFDAAHAFASEHPRGPVGRFGDAEVFSFHATKFIHSAEGGAVTTSSDDLAEELRLLRNFGFTGLDQVERVGTNAKLSELHAAMGLTSLEELPRLLEINRRNYETYRAVLGAIPGLRLLEIPPAGRHNRQYIVVTVESPPFPFSRDELAAVLWSENVLARRYFTPGCHRIPAFEPYLDAQPVLPHTDALCQTVLQLPTGGSVTEEDVEQIGRLIHMACAEAGRVREQLALRGSTMGGGGRA